MSRTVIVGLRTIRRRMTTGATIASNRPTNPAVAVATVSPSRTAIAALRIAAETTTAEARKVRRWAPAVWSTNRSVPPLRATLMNCPQTLVAEAKTMMVSRMSTRATPKSSFLASSPRAWLAT